MPALRRRLRSSLREPHFLKQLTRAGVPCRELLHFYTAVIRPVLEYAALVWHYAITKHKHSNLSQSRSGQLYFAIRLESRKSANKRIYLSIYLSLERHRPHRELRLRSRTARRRRSVLRRSTSCYVKAERPGVGTTTSESRDQRHDRGSNFFPIHIPSRLGGIPLSN